MNSRMNNVCRRMEIAGLKQLLITDPWSIYYLTGKLFQPGERFLGLLLKESGDHKVFINHLFPAPEELGVEKSGLDRLIQCSYDLLGLISFLTYGKDECRAWTIKKGTKAPQAAGKIHSDIERGFIRAETINFDEMMACGGSVAAAKEKGLLRSEGKDYVVKDGDMIYFRFNV